MTNPYKPYESQFSRTAYIERLHRLLANDRIDALRLTPHEAIAIGWALQELETETFVAPERPAPAKPAAVQTPENKPDPEAPAVDITREKHLAWWKSLRAKRGDATFVSYKAAFDALRKVVVRRPNGQEFTLHLGNRGELCSVSTVDGTIDDCSAIARVLSGLQSQDDEAKPATPDGSKCGNAAALHALSRKYDDILLPEERDLIGAVAAGIELDPATPKPPTRLTIDPKRVDYAAHYEDPEPPAALADLPPAEQVVREAIGAGETQELFAASIRGLAALIERERRAAFEAGQRSVQAQHLEAVRQVLLEDFEEVGPPPPPSVYDEIRAARERRYRVSLTIRELLNGVRVSVHGPSFDAEAPELRARLLEIAALCVAAIEAHDSDGGRS